MEKMKKEEIEMALKMKIMEEKKNLVKRVREPGRCPICQKMFQNKFHIKRHILLKHQKNREYPCPDCSYSAGTASDLGKHRLQHNFVAMLKDSAKKGKLGKLH